MNNINFFSLNAGTSSSLSDFPVPPGAVYTDLGKAPTDFDNISYVDSHRPIVGQYVPNRIEEYRLSIPFHNFGENSFTLVHNSKNGGGINISQLNTIFAQQKQITESILRTVTQYDPLKSTEDWVRNLNFDLRYDSIFDIKRPNEIQTALQKKYGNKAPNANIFTPKHTKHHFRPYGVYQAQGVQNIHVITPTQTNWNVKNRSKIVDYWSEKLEKPQPLTKVGFIVKHDMGGKLCVVPWSGKTERAFPKVQEGMGIDLLGFQSYGLYINVGTVLDNNDGKLPSSNLLHENESVALAAHTSNRSLLWVDLSPNIFGL